MIYRRFQSVGAIGMVQLGLYYSEKTSCPVVIHALCQSSGRPRQERMKVMILCNGQYTSPRQKVRYAFAPSSRFRGNGKSCKQRILEGNENAVVWTPSSALKWSLSPPLLWIDWNSMMS